MENAGRQNHSVKVIPNNCLPEIRTRSGSVACLIPTARPGILVQWHPGRYRVIQWQVWALLGWGPKTGWVAGYPALARRTRDQAEASVRE